MPATLSLSLSLLARRTALSLYLDTEPSSIRTLMIKFCTPFAYPATKCLPLVNREYVIHYARAEKKGKKKKKREKRKRRAFCRGNAAKGLIAI